jgi:hypothetical protein
MGHVNVSVLRKVNTVKYLGYSRFFEGEMGLRVKIVDFMKTLGISVNRDLEA